MKAIKNAVAVLALSLLACAGCVRSSVTQLSPDSAMITARGSAFNDMGDVQKRMLSDAATLTLQRGYDYFTVIGSSGGYTTAYITTPGTTQTQTDFNAMVTPYSVNGTATTYSYATPTTTNSIEKPRADISIRMYRGTPASNDPNSFDARSILSMAQ